MIFQRDAISKGDFTNAVEKQSEKLTAGQSGYRCLVHGGSVSELGIRVGRDNSVSGPI